MNTDELKILEKIYQEFRKIETLDINTVTEDLLVNINLLLSQLKESSNLEFRKLSDIRKHLKPNISLQHFINFLIPIERALNKNIKDDDFLISSTDSLSEIIIDKLPIVLVLDNIRSAFNVGSIFRTADAMCVSKIYCCGYTPTPEEKSLQKTALGSEHFIDFKKGNTLEVIQKLKETGYKIIGIETSKKALSIYSDFDHTPTALVLGNERFGLDTPILKLCDEIRFIPMGGFKNSLNVSVCTGIVLSEWKRQWQK